MVELEAEKYKNGLLKDFFLKSKNDDRRLGFGQHFLLFSIAESNVENYLYRSVLKISVVGKIVCNLCFQPTLPTENSLFSTKTGNFR